MSTQTKPLTDNDIMPFGKYKGKALINVPAKYLLWLYNDGCDHPGLRQYLNENLDALNKEVSKSSRY
jgi:uncharacterized protein (DUF3820 family)